MSASPRAWSGSGPTGEPVEFPLEGDALEVGRDEEAAIRVDEPLVSRRHARLERRGEAWVVLDLDSTNFTRVNGAAHPAASASSRTATSCSFARARCVFRRQPG